MNRREVLRKTIYLAGTAVSYPALVSLLHSCGKQDRRDWEPIFLNKGQAEFVTAFVDTMLPRTTTPGALDVNVDVFIDLIFAKTYDDKAQSGIRTEIDQFNADCKSKYGKYFADLSDADKALAFQTAESGTAKFNGSVWGTAVGNQQPVGFYRRLKSMTLWAFFTSEEIGKNHLNYDPIPGEFLGCIPLEEAGNTSSL